jgi:diacylglycerol kinase (ATP)
VGKVVVIRNPRSGRGKWNAKWAQILAKLGDPEVKETNGPGHATELARQTVMEGADLVVAAGGDGTVTQVANGLIGSNATLAWRPQSRQFLPIIASQWT